ncbi:complement receptor type 2-like isoform X5 [Alligator mississippiensis]|uniref:complement receptor type 2-like isoform X5 n=1 Tax=Alligator mississippiensis TaxID=8496 RepID=UPI0028773BFA|nr:complement receptor type 2-like isoform X5 [Alligator mississippiensis]
MASLCPGDQNCYVATLRILCAAALVVAVQSACGPLPRLNYAVPKEDYSNRTSFPVGFTVDFNCRPGYTKRSTSSLRCQRNSEWVVPFYPFCTGRPCPHPAAPDNGQVAVLTDLQFGSTINFTCEDGYRLIGSSQSRCVIVQGGVNWDRDVPVCQLIPCLPPPTINHGTHNAVSLEEFSYGTSVTYKCDNVRPGEIPFSLVGEASIYCTSQDNHNGVWSGPPPECKAIHCKTPNLDNGRVMNRYTTLHTFKNILLIECNKRYTLYGSSTIQCNENSTWSPSVPVCQRSSCDDPPMTDRITQRSFSFSSEEPSAEFPVGSVFTYTCWPGYEFRPGENKFTITCQSNFQWSEDPSPCQRVSCPTPHIDHGTVVLSSWLRGLYATRDVGRKFLYDDTIRIQCNPGYGFHGDNVILCDQSGNWSPAIPQCVRVPACPSPHIEHGTLVSSPEMVHTPGSTVEVRCNAGYVLIGPKSIECQPDETWKSPVPFCDKACGPPPDIKRGQHSGGTKEHFFYGSEVKYSCAEGLSLIGESSIYCTSGEDLNMTWSGPAPRCAMVRCPRPVIENGRMTTSRHVFLYGTTVQFSCSEGYMMDGSRESQCQEGSIWDPPLPSCRLVQCPKPDLRHGAVTGKQVEKPWYSMNETITFSCPEHHRFLGCWHLFTTDTWTITCSADGRWTEIPKCVKEEEVDKMAYDVKEFRQCDSSLLQVRILQEMQNLKLEVKSLKEEIRRVTSLPGVSCPTPHIDHGTVVLSSRQQELYATRDEGRKYLYDDIIRIQCNPGYGFHGDNVILCDQSGNWSPAIPQCVRGGCDNPPVTNKTMQRSFSFSSEEPSTEFPVGSVFTYTCRPGYEFRPGENKLTVTCQSNFQWSKDPSPCRRVSCPSPHIDHGTVVLGQHLWELYVTRDEGRKFLYDDTITIQCNPGYGLRGDDSIRCNQSGSWSSAIPQCVRGSCDDPPMTDRIMQRSFSFSSEEPSTEFPVGSVFTYTCRPGYEFRPGENKFTITCQSNFQWSEDPSPCQRVSCPTPHIDHGTVVLGQQLWELYVTRDEGRKFLYDDTITIQCNPGYGLRGDDSIRCNQSGSWSPAIPQCVRGSCDDPPMTDRITQRSFSFSSEEPSTEFPVGSVFTYTCWPGYEFSPGENKFTVTCQSNFQWSEFPSPCRRVSRPSPHIDHGTVVLGPRLRGLYITRDEGRRYLYEDIIRIQCNPGYGFHGDDLIFCDKSGSWSPAIPQCVRVPACPSPHIEHGTLVSSPEMVHTPGSTVEVRCNAGYVLIGPNSIECQPDETWKSPVPFCDKACGPPPDIKRGQHSGGTKEHFFYGSEVKYSCAEGLSLIGESSIYCTSGEDLNMTWSGPAPRCAMVRCPRPVIENGRMTTSRHVFLYGTTVQFSCSKGYMMDGSRESQCQEGSIWNPPLPSCRLVQCPKPDLRHGAVTGKQVEKPWYSMNETITFSCPEHHRFLGCWHLFTTDTWTITCSADGRWTEIPKCVKEEEVDKMAYDVKKFRQCDSSLLQVRILQEMQNLKLEVKSLKDKIKLLQ